MWTNAAFVLLTTSCLFATTSQAQQVVNVSVVVSERNSQYDATATACPRDLYHCADPSRVHSIPCDAETCLWDLTALDASGPPGFCQQVNVVHDEVDVLYDEVKPCILWNRFFDTPAEEENNNNKQYDDDTTPDANVHSISMDRFLVYMFFTAPPSLVTTALTDPKVLHILRYHMNEHIEEVVSQRLNSDVKAHTVVGVVDTPTAPWRNGTVVAILSVSVSIETTSALPEDEAVHAMVKAAITDPVWRQERLSVYAVLNRAYTITTQPVDWTSASSPFGKNVLNDNTHKSAHWTSHVRFWTQEFWAPIEWGVWRDVDFIIFVSVVGGCLFWGLCCCVSCCILWRQRRRRQRRGNAKLEQEIMAAVNTLEEEADEDPQDREQDETEIVERDVEAAINVSESTFGPNGGTSLYSACSYIEEEVDDDDDDIQSFSVNPESTYDFDVSPPQATAAAAVDDSTLSYVEELVSDEEEEEEDDCDVVSETSTISRHTVNLENESRKGTVVVYNDSDSVSTASDSIISAVLDFAKAAWQPKKRSPPPYQAGSKHSSSSSSGKHSSSSSSSRNSSSSGSKSGVRAAIATFEKVSATNQTSRMIPLPKNTASSNNVMGILSSIENEHRLPKNQQKSTEQSKDTDVEVVDVTTMHNVEDELEPLSPAPETTIQQIAPLPANTPSVAVTQPRIGGMFSSIKKMFFMSPRPTEAVVLSDIEDGLTAPSAEPRASGDSLASGPPTDLNLLAHNEAELLKAISRVVESEDEAKAATSGGVEVFRPVVCPKPQRGGAAGSKKSNNYGTKSLRLPQRSAAKAPAVAKSPKSSSKQKQDPTEIPTPASAKASVAEKIAMLKSNKQATVAATATKAAPPKTAVSANSIPRSPAVEETKKASNVKSIFRSQTPPARLSQQTEASPGSPSTTASSAPNTPERSVARAGTVFARISVFEKKATTPLPPFPVPSKRFVVKKPDASAPPILPKRSDMLPPKPKAAAVEKPLAQSNGLASNSTVTSATAPTVSDDHLSHDTVSRNTAASVVETLGSNHSTLLSHSPSEQVDSTTNKANDVPPVLDTTSSSQGFDEVTLSDSYSSAGTGDQAVAAQGSPKLKAADHLNFIDISKSKTSSLAMDMSQRSMSTSPKKPKKTSVSDAVKAFEKNGKSATPIVPVPSASKVQGSKSVVGPAATAQGISERKAVVNARPKKATAPTIKGPPAVVGVPPATVNSSTIDTSPAVPSQNQVNAEEENVPSWLKRFNQLKVNPSPNESVETRETVQSLYSGDTCENPAIMIADDHLALESSELEDRVDTEPVRSRGRSRRPPHKDLAPVKLTSRIDGNTGAYQVEQNISILSIDSDCIDSDRVVKSSPERRAQSAAPHDRQKSSFLGSWGQKTAKQKASSDLVEAEGQPVQPKGGFILRTDLDLTFKKGRRSKSAAPRDRQKEDILRSWGDTKIKDRSPGSSSFVGKSARPSKATKLVLCTTNPESPGTPLTLPSTPLSQIEYQDSECDIKSICSKDPVFSVYESPNKSPVASPTKRMGSLRLTDHERSLLTVAEGQTERTWTLPSAYKR